VDNEIIKKRLLTCCLFNAGFGGSESSLQFINFVSVENEVRLNPALNKQPNVIHKATKYK